MPQSIQLVLSIQHCLDRICEKTDANKFQSKQQYHWEQDRDVELLSLDVAPK